MIDPKVVRFGTLMRAIHHSVRKEKRHTPQEDYCDCFCAQILSSLINKKPSNIQYIRGKWAQIFTGKYPKRNGVPDLYFQEIQLNDFDNQQKIIAKKLKEIENKTVPFENVEVNLKFKCGYVAKMFIEGLKNGDYIFAEELSEENQVRLSEVEKDCYEYIATLFIFTIKLIDNCVDTKRVFKEDMGLFKDNVAFREIYYNIHETINPYYVMDGFSNFDPIVNNHLEKNDKKFSLEFVYRINSLTSFFLISPEDIMIFFEVGEYKYFGGFTANRLFLLNSSKNLYELEFIQRAFIVRGGVFHEPMRKFIDDSYNLKKTVFLSGWFDSIEAMNEKFDQMLVEAERDKKLYTIMISIELSENFFRENFAQTDTSRDETLILQKIEKDYLKVMERIIPEKATLCFEVYISEFRHLKHGAIVWGLVAYDTINY